MSLAQPRSHRRLSLELAVLNDMCINVSSEKACGFMHPKKDKYEQEIFQLEDQRYELDMIIDANSACVAVLESITTTFYRNSCSAPSKTIITATVAENVLLWNSFPGPSTPPDVVLYSSQIGTPRSIISNGEYIMIGDENASWTI